MAVGGTAVGGTAVGGTGDMEASFPALKLVGRTGIFVINGFGVGVGVEIMPLMQKLHFTFQFHNSSFSIFT
jgi:hypothetical protein